MGIEVSWIGAVVALIVSIVLIVKKVNPAYGLVLGAFVGGIVGGAGFGTVNLMIDGAKNMTPAILRIFTAGVLAGVLIKSGAAKKIAETITSKIGESKALVALTLSTMILTAAGVFVDVAVITVSPIALSIANKSKISKSAILIAMIGGGKAGNIMSPNPNTIAAADNLKVPLTSLMVSGIIPAIIGIILTCIIASKFTKKGTYVNNEEINLKEDSRPSFLGAIIGPIVTIMLLVLRPLFNINIDPLVALPVGGFVGVICMGKIKNLNEYASYGLSKMTGVIILLLGTGTLGGIIANSGLKDLIIGCVNSLHLPSFILAPISGILMSAATASTTSGTAIASSVFGPAIVELGVTSIATAAMIHVGATVLDSLPHGSFFHATGGSVGMDMKERLRLIPFEALIGFTMTIVSTIIYGIII